MKQYKQRIIGSLGLTAIVLAIGGFLFPSLPSSSMESEFFWANKSYCDKRFDVVFIGDSRIYRGINPVAVEEGLGSKFPLRVFNFGYSSVGLDTGFLNAGADLLDVHSAQPIIVLGVNPSSVADENMDNKHYTQEKERSAYTIWQRKYINPHLSHFNPTNPEMVRNELEGRKEGYFQVHYDNGWIASDRQPRDITKDLWLLERSFDNATIDLKYIDLLLKKVRQWRAKGIRVFAFRPPASKAFEAVLNRVSAYPEQAIVTQLKAAGVTWLPIDNRYNYTTYDGSHLVDTSASRLSNYLGQAIKKALLPEKTPLLYTKQGFEALATEDWTTVEQEHLNTTTYQGDYSAAVAPNAFSSTLQVNLGKFAVSSVKIKSQCWLRSKDSLPASPVVLVAEINDSTGNVLWQGQQWQEQCLRAHEWNCLQLELPNVPITPQTMLKVYLWNNGSETVLLDEVEVKIFALE